MRRRHRRVHHPATSCGCPEGSRKVSTCKKTSGLCKGRKWGCLGTGTTTKGKRIPRFVKMTCSSEAGPVQQWGEGKRKPRKRSKAETSSLFAL